MLMKEAEFGGFFPPLPQDTLLNPIHGTEITSFNVINYIKIGSALLSGTAETHTHTPFLRLMFVLGFLIAVQSPHPKDNSQARTIVKYD